MHSSRMRTIRTCGRGGGVSAPGGVWSWGGVCSGGQVVGVDVWSGGCLLGGVCLVPGGVSAPGGVCSRGCLLQGGVCSWGGVCFVGCLLQWGVCSRGVSVLGVCGIPACNEADTPTTPPPRGQTHTCKNITFATSLWTVTRKHYSRMRTAHLPTVRASATRCQCQ